MSITYKAKRRVVRIVLLAAFFAVPFINIGGNPLLRFDAREMAIYVAGVSLTPSHIFPALLLFLSGLFFFIFITQLFGRIWCGWLCPQTLLLDCAGDLSFKIRNKAYDIVVKLLVSVLVVAGLILYTMPPADFIPRLANGDISPIWAVVALIIFLELLLVGRTFCKTVCPYSIFQSVMFDADTMRVGFHPERVNDCIKCKACVRVCPTGLDIREGLNNKCVSCASCVDACAKILAKLGKKTCVDYFYGRLKFKPFRVNTVITLVLASVLLVIGSVTMAKVGSDVQIKAGNVIYADGAYTVELSVVNKLDNNIAISIKSDDADVETEKPSYRIHSKDSILIPVKLTSGKDRADLRIEIFEHRREWSQIVPVELKK